MPTTVEVRPVQNKSEFTIFFEFPWNHYRNDPNWVPPLVSIRRSLLDKSKHPAWKYMEGEYFVAWRGEEAVGTIAAVINHHHNEFHEEHIGFFGLFELINDQEVANALLEKATEWVKSRGYDEIRGPANLSSNDEWGILVDNYSRPMILMPYNPPYYQTLIENAGFVKAMDVYSMYIDRKLIEEHDTFKRLERIVNRATKRSNITVRKIDMRRKKEEFLVFKEIYNAAWDKNWGFIPMNDEELDALVADLGMLVDPDLAFFAEIDGQPAGFALSVPDFNEVVSKAYPRPGVPELWSLAQIGWNWKVRNIIKGVRMPLMGVKSEFRDRGVDLAMFLALMRSLMPSKYEYLDSGWILETNELVKISLSLGNQIYKTHRLYSKMLKD